MVKLLTIILLAAMSVSAQTGTTNKPELAKGLDQGAKEVDLSNKDIQVELLQAQHQVDAVDQEMSFARDKWNELYPQLVNKRAAAIAHEQKVIDEAFAYHKLSKEQYDIDVAKLKFERKEPKQEKEESPIKK